MHSPLFEQIGLSPNEAKIYECLLENRKATVSTISLKANVHRRNVYDALNRLIEKGLVFRIIGEGENRFEAVNPQKLMEVLKEKEHALEKSLPDLHKLFTREPAGEAVFIYKGLEGYKNYRRDLLRVGKEVCFLGAKALWRTPSISPSLHQEFKREFAKKKIQYKTLFDPRVPEELPEALKDVGGEIKVLPKGYETVGVVDIFGDRIATFTSEGVGNFGENGSIIIMINKQLADSYRTWFNLIWDLCPIPTDRRKHISTHLA